RGSRIGSADRATRQRNGGCEEPAGEEASLSRTASRAKPVVGTKRLADLDDGPLRRTLNRPVAAVRRKRGWRTPGPGKNPASENPRPRPSARPSPLAARTARWR